MFTKKAFTHLNGLVTLHFMLCVVVAVRAVAVAAHHSVGKTLAVAERYKHTKIHIKLQSNHIKDVVCVCGWVCLSSASLVGL